MSILDNPYQSKIEKYADQYGINRDWFTAMIARESGFKATETSASNARGLTQVIYITKSGKRNLADLVDEVAAKHGLPKNANALYDPDVSLEVGARHLAWCVTSEGGDYIRGIRKYHSGRADPPKDFEDGQGTTSDQHINAVLQFLAEVKAARGDTPGTGDGTGGDTTMPETAAKPYILIFSGHRSTGDGGNASERARTDELALAYTKAFRAAGYTADWFQRDLDKDALPDMTSGDLTTVALGARKILASRPEALCIMLDLHYDGPTSSVHVLVPDGAGLGAAFTGNHSADTAAANVLDVKLAKTIAKMIADANGLPLYGGGRLGIRGVMSEKDSGVGLGGSRLGMFSATVGQQAKAARLIIEHAGWNMTATKKAGFEDRCAAAAVAAVNLVLPTGVTTPIPDPVPEPEPTKLVYPKGLSKELASVFFGGVAAFNEDGPVSQLWLDEGKRTGRFPALDLIHETSAGAKYYQFVDGTLIWTPKNGDEPLRVLRIEL